MPRVAYNLDSLSKCRCGACPLHQASQCITTKMAGMKMQPGVLPPANVLEGMYCSEAVGKSRCNDLDNTKACICPTCAVWSENNLSSSYFCTRGSELEIEGQRKGPGIKL
ncbi:MAG: DUF2769 domain-containing protein [Dehalococcoidales bacterium]|nr:DUF2769 domain-containing protein [Dehalococcoidales bacterium]